MKKIKTPVFIVAAIVLLAVLYFAAYSCGEMPGWGNNIGVTQSEATADESVFDDDVFTGDERITSLFEQRISDVQVKGEGTVLRLLSDDESGDRHQRFILELDNGHTLLMAHNIDIAPRLDDLDVGDRVAFFGEYYYSEEGGGVHWTHHDPDGTHADGWLRLNSKTYD